jgi:hypothetical protein
VRALQFRFLAAVVAAFGVASIANGANYTQTVENTPGLLGYWQFSPSTQANSSVNGFTGTFTGQAQVGPANSGPVLADDPTNTAVQLDGNGSFVNTNLVGGIGTQGSMVGWFKLATLPSTAGRIFTIAGESNFGDDFDLQINTDNAIHFYSSASSSTVDPVALTSGDLNTWIFVAATFTSATDRQVYVNGILVASSLPGIHSAASATFAMGESDVFTGRYFQGSLDEIAVYNRELSANEIATIYASQSEVPEPASLGLVALCATTLLGRRCSRGRTGRSTLHP